MTGIKFGSAVLIDLVLPFGASVSCKIFECFSTFLNWIFKRVTDCPDIGHYLDDFFGMAAPAPCKKAGQVLDTMKETAIELGVPLHPQKCEGPCTSLIILGMGVDTVAQTVFAPPDKVTRALVGIRQILRLHQVRVQLIMSTLGLLSFLTKAVAPGRAFLHRPFKAIRGMTKSQFCQLSNEAKKDLESWQTFLKSYNGLSYFVMDDGTQGRSYMLFSDACTSHGAAVWCGKFGEYVYIKWPQAVINNDRKPSTCLLELIPICYAFFVPKWSLKFANRQVTIFCDNMSTCRVVSKLASRVSDISDWLRPLTMRLMHLNVKLNAQFVPTDRQLADSLSRGRFDIFRAQIGTGQKQVYAVTHGLPSLQTLIRTKD